MMPISIREQIEQATQNLDPAVVIIAVALLCVVILIVALFIVDPKFSKENLEKNYYTDENGRLRRIPKKYADGVYEEGDLEYAAKVDAEIAEAMDRAKAARAEQEQRAEDTLNANDDVVSDSADENE